MSNVANPARPGTSQNRENESQNPNRGSQGGSSSSSATGVMDMAKDAANYVGEQCNSAMKTAQDAVSSAGKRAEDATHAAGAGIKSFGHSVREYAPETNYVKDATCAVADTIENTGKYIEEEGLAGMAEDLTSLIKKNPIPALFIGIGVGFLLARACMRS
jgi:hypothetical protein